MPKKPKRPCSSPGCPELTDGRFCPEHAKREASRYEKYQRDPETRKRYGRAWKRIRDRYIAVHPLCEECKRQGKLTPATEVHHILPLARGGTHDESNLMALCTPCHSAITARDGDRWPSRQGGVESLQPFKWTTGVGLRAKRRSFKRGNTPLIRNEVS